jgi:hypothetical protein
MEDQFDALLYLGLPSEITMLRLPPKLCEDRSYMDMRIQRMTLAGMQRLIDRLQFDTVVGRAFHATRGVLVTG